MKVTFFLGRVHHAIKLLPVATELQKRGVRIDILVTDNSINIDPTTEYLPQYGIHEYHHVNDYLDGYQPVEWEIMPLSLYGHVPPFWVHHSTTELAKNIYGMRAYLDHVKPDAVFGLHENNFFVKPLFYCAQERGIRTYSLQEGIILEREENDLGKYSIGTDYTDTLFAWSDYDKRFYSDPDKIVAVGPSHLDRWINEGIPKHGGKVIVFAPPRLDLYRGDPLRAMKKLALWTRDRGIKLVIKLHPFQGGVEQVRSFLSAFNHVDITKDNASIQYIAIADVVVTQTSTIAMEAVILGVPVVEIDLDYIGLEQPLWKHGAATLIESHNVDSLLDTKSASGFVKDRFPLADGKSTERIADYVMSARRIK